MITTKIHLRSIANHEQPLPGILVLTQHLLAIFGKPKYNLSVVVSGNTHLVMMG